MQRSAAPTKFQLAWAANAGVSFIRTVPVASQIGINAGAASYNDGFVPDNFTQIAAGGVPPFGQDMNGVLNETTVWDQWYQAGGPILYDSAFATAIGGYPEGAVVDSAVVLGAQWYSTADNNSTNPDDPLTSTNWARVGLPAGTPLQSLTSTLPAGFVAMNALTIGGPSSNAGYARADALFLYVANWVSFSNAQCPILTSAGVPTTRGANAVADFQANKQLTLPNGKGIGLIGADTMGGAASTFLSGVPIVSGNSTTPGSVVGENGHTLSLAETATGINSSGTNTINVSGASSQNLGFSYASVGLTGGGGVFVNSPTGISTVVTNSSGSNTINVQSNNTGGGSHNNVERSMIVYWGQKL